MSRANKSLPTSRKRRHTGRSSSFPPPSVSARPSRRRMPATRTRPRQVNAEGRWKGCASRIVMLWLIFCRFYSKVGPPFPRHKYATNLLKYYVPVYQFEDQTSSYRQADDTEDRLFLIHLSFLPLWMLHFPLPLMRRVFWFGRRALTYSFRSTYSHRISLFPGFASRYFLPFGPRSVFQNVLITHGASSTEPSSVVSSSSSNASPVSLT